MRRWWTPWKGLLIMSSQAFTGQRPAPRGSEAKVLGNALYTGDLELESMLHGAILRAPCAHAKILSIDTSAARDIAGVEAVITSQDLADLRYVHMPRFSDRHVLAKDKVRFYGEEVAAVAATDVRLAREAIAAIDVRYSSLAYAETAERALKRYAPQINAGPGGALKKNLALKFNRDLGDVDAAEARATLTVEGRYAHEASVPASLEAGGTVAHFDQETASLYVWTVSQAPFLVRWELAEVLQLEREQVHVMPVSVGAMPSARANCGEHAAIAAALSMKTGRPVKVMLLHHEDAITGRSDAGQRLRMRQSLDRDGNILARSVSVLVDNGAYASLAPAHLIAGRQVAAGLYRVRSARFDWQLAYSNKLAGGVYPSLGIPQLLWAIEDQMDRAAEALAIDPLEYRLQQANRRGDVTPLGQHVQGSELVACLEAVRDRIDWQAKRAASEAGKGVGVASCVWPSAGMLRAEGFACEVSLELQADGRIRLESERTTADAWQNGLLIEACAQVLGIDEKRIDLVARQADGQAAQATLAPFDETLVLIDAVKAASNAFASRLRAELAEAFGAKVDGIQFDGDGMRIKGRKEIRRGLAKVHELIGGCASIAASPRSVLEAPDEQGDLSEMYSYSALAAEVEIDPLTGKVSVLRVVLALDIGIPLNTHALEAEVRDGIMRGLGMALAEPMRYDAGKPVTTSLASLAVPRIGDVPEVDIVLVPTQSPAGPFHAKATGESAAHATIAAVAGAIAHASGVRLETLPFTPERVHAALTRAKEAQQTRQKIPTYPWAHASNFRDAAMRSTLNVSLVRRQVPLQSAQAYDYVLAKSLGEVFEHLLRSRLAVKIRAGGTELTPGIRQGIYRPELVLDISRISELARVQRTHNCLRIGACTSLREMAEDAEVRNLFPSLVDGVSKIATTGVRSLATVGGNLCQQKQCDYYRNGFPCRKRKGAGHPCFAVSGDHRRHSIMRTWPCAAPCPSDLAPLLDVLDADLLIGSSSGERRMPAGAFYHWSGEPKLAPDELLLAVEIPLSATSRSTAFEKYAHQAGSFALASVAVSLGTLQGQIQSSRMTLGGISPFPERARLAERILVEQRPTPALIREAALAAVRGALPMRMNASKVALVVQLAERALRRALAL